MSSALRAHSSCALCQQRRDPCIYRFFGPCKFDEETDACLEAEGDEQKAELQQKEITRRQLDQSQLVLLDDQILSVVVETDKSRLDRLL